MLWSMSDDSSYHYFMNASVRHRMKHEERNDSSSGTSKPNRLQLLLQ